MLATLAEFPHVGSIAWLRPNGERPEPAQVRILRANADGTRLIAFAAPASFRHPASGNTTVPAADLFATRAAALEPHAPRKPRRSVRS